jgi:hypothetical protein
MPVEQHDDEKTALRRLRVLRERAQSMAEPIDVGRVQKGLVMAIRRLARLRDPIRLG